MSDVWTLCIDSYYILCTRCPNEAPVEVTILLDNTVNSILYI
jgi:hypothetical protein